MPDIKVKDIAKGTVKAIDKSAIAAQRMKNAYIRTKEKAEHSAMPQENLPEEYAAGRVSGGLDSAQKAIREFDRQGRKGVKTTKENISKAKDYFEKRAAHQPKKQVQRKAAESIRRTTGNAKKTIKTVDRSGKTIKQTAKSTAKGTVKTARKTVKTAERTAKTTIKTTQQAAKAAQKTVQTTARAARAAAHAARAAAKAAAVTAKAVAKAIALAVKAIIAGTKALIAAIAAGGWIAVLVIIVICLIGMIIGSCFGIFFSSEDSGSGMTMQSVVQEINTEYQDKLDEIKASHTYDVLEMSGSRAVWKEVLAVYAVKTTTDPDNAQEVATMDDSKKQLLKDIFWEMNAISSSTDTKTETVIETSDDGNGNIVETEVTVTQTYLYITVSHKTADEMAAQYGFNEDQKEQLSELLADENNSLWTSVLYGITGSDGEIVSVALSQIGNIGGEPYWSWYGFSGRVEWCACFVSWCANECGYIESGIIPKFAGCVQGSNWFKERGLWQDNSYEPRPGDIIFFDWADETGQDGSSDHVGIVQKVEDGRVYTVEGNSGDECRQNSYPIGYYEIYGYGTPAY
ncbi:CHAP domain-containing protein [Bittarella massiliensis (ex Durand et al. 2017)]|uniref:CHAP domain-containing protein n=3 Tax=Eubacteriales TaxID=186802 RepID=A0AAQ1MFH0_9FIRM|nr:CHAP domain-containing protein [Bittarella massiliensis (ex Durand et al. 2017)]SHG58297.1 CHAP domain-containing protein [Bittarella massiliensis (ex Durand et al. 2017)]